MKKIEVGNMVKVVNCIPWNGRRGELIDIVYEGRRKEYIVQFTNPVEWCFFSRKELRWAE